MNNIKEVVKRLNYARIHDLDPIEVPLGLPIPDSPEYIDATMCNDTRIERIAKEAAAFRIEAAKKRHKEAQAMNKCEPKRDPNAAKPKEVWLKFSEDRSEVSVLINGYYIATFTAEGTLTLHSHVSACDTGLIINHYGGVVSRYASEEESES